MAPEEDNQLHGDVSQTVENIQGEEKDENRWKILKVVNRDFDATGPVRNVFYGAPTVESRDTLGTHCEARGTSREFAYPSFSTSL